VILVRWEHPTDINFVTARLVSGSDIVDPDVTLGVAVDATTNVVRPYSIEYLSAIGLPVATVNPTRVLPVPDAACLVSFEVTRLDSLPDVNRRIAVTFGHDPGVPEVTDVYYTNQSGRATVPIARGTRVFIHLENNTNGLDVIIPDAQTADYDDLVLAGSHVIADRRGWF
jgi:hypothetical protein